MSNYDPKRLIQDFGQRTLTNLDFIEAHKNIHQADLFETTQLINSLFGLVVFPYERIFRRTPPMATLVDLIDQGWPELNITMGKQHCVAIGDLIKNMRHGVSHAKIKFLADERNEIVGIVLWNCRPETDIKIWEARMSIQDLKKIIRKFNEMLQEIPEEIADEFVAMA